MPSLARIDLGVILAFASHSHSHSGKGPATRKLFNRLLPAPIKRPLLSLTHASPLFPPPLSLVVSHPLPLSSPSCPFATAFYYGHKSIRALTFGIRLTGHSGRSLRSGACVHSFTDHFGTKIRISAAVSIPNARVRQLAVAERAGRDGSRKSSKFCDIQHSVSASHGISQGTHSSSIVPFCHRNSYCKPNLTLPSPLGAKSDAWIAIRYSDAADRPVWVGAVLPSTAIFRCVDRTITCTAAVWPGKSAYGFILDSYA